MRLDEPLERRLVALAVCAQVLVLTSIIAVVFLMTGDIALDATEPDKDVVIYVVQPGDSLWTIARRFRPQESPELVIAEILNESGLQGVDLKAYQQIRIPTPRYRDG